MVGLERNLMKALIRALALAGVLIATSSVAPAMVQGETVAAVATPPTPLPKADIKKAISRIRRAYRKDVPCGEAAYCATYFDTFGVALTFSDGTIEPFAHQQRLKRTGHDCIQEARVALDEGNRALAVQWTMAAYLDDPLTRNWLADHPDAVLEGLRHFGDGPS
jgi:hypothetical protein